MNPVLKIALPALFAGLLGGYFLGKGTAGSGGRAKATTPRAAFLSSEDDEVNYEKLARVCLTAAERARPTRTKGAPLADPSSPEVAALKRNLDGLMETCLERGEWSRMASFRAQNILRRLPATDVADFEGLLRTTLQRGDLKAQSGAWLPDNME